MKNGVMTAPLFEITQWLGCGCIGSTAPYHAAYGGDKSAYRNGVVVYFGSHSVTVYDHRERAGHGLTVIGYPLVFIGYALSRNGINYYVAGVGAVKGVALACGFGIGND